MKHVFVHSSQQREERTKKRRRGYRAIRSDADASFGGCGRSGAAELAPLKQSSPFSLLGCRPRCPINAVCFAICFLLLIKGRLLQCSEACFCSFFSTARRTNGESAAAVIGLFARTPPRRLFCFAAKYLLFVIFAPIYSAYCKKMAYNFCFL